MIVSLTKDQREELAQDLWKLRAFAKALSKSSLVLARRCESAGFENAKLFNMAEYALKYEKYLRRIALSIQYDWPISEGDLTAMEERYLAMMRGETRGG